MGVSISFAQTADDVINKAIDARGGKEKIANLKSIKMKAMVDIGPNMKAPMTMYILNDKGFRLEMEMQGMTMIQCIDGDSGWYVMPFGGKKDAERMDKETIQQMSTQMDIQGGLFNYKAKGSTVVLLGKDDMEGTETFKLKLTKKNGDVETWFLDASSYMPLKVTSKHKMKEKEVSSDVLLSNYKKVDGIMFAYTMDEREAGAAQGQAVTFDTIEVNPKIENSIFKMPATTAATTPAGGDKK